MKMTRRGFIANATALGAAGAVHLSATRPTPSDRPKNIIFVTVDQQTANELGCMGNAAVHTPNLDRLASEGVLFRQMFCQAVTCGPSRVAMITGRYCHATGMHRNDTILPPHEQTLAESLRQAGYYSAALGKVESIGIESGLVDEADGFLQGFHEFHALKKGSAGDLTKSILAGDSAFSDMDRQKYSAVWRGDIEDHFDVGSLRSAQRILEDHRDDPTFLWLAFHQPHRPIAPPARFADQYDPATIELPPSVDMELVNRPRHIMDRAKSKGTADITRDELRTLLARRYASASFLDDCVGQLMETVRSLDQEQDTVLVYISDGGSYAGNYGWHRKFPFMPYDCLLHVPAFVWAPGRISPTAPVDALVEEIDLMPTVLEVAGVEIPRGVQGKSLLPLIRGKTDQLHDAVFAETGFDPRCINVRTLEWSFTYHYNGACELYNLVEDPYETRNVYGQHPEIETRLRDRLLKWRMDTGAPELERRRRNPA